MRLICSYTMKAIGRTSAKMSGSSAGKTPNDFHQRFTL